MDITVGSVVYALMVGGAGIDARRGVVTVINGDGMAVSGPWNHAHCLLAGAVLVPDNLITPEERAFSLSTVKSIA